MKCLAIAETFRHGGPEFDRESSAFCKIWNCPRLELNNGGFGLKSHRWPWNRRAVVRFFLEHYGKNHGRVQTVAIFGHGTASKLLATGHSKRHVGQLADALAGVLTQEAATVILYSCLTGRGKKGFADLLWEELQRRGINARVLSHTVRGHTTFSPFVEFSGGPAGGVLVIGKNHPFWNIWRQRLYSDQHFRLTFWAMSRQQLIDELDPAFRMDDD